MVASYVPEIFVPSEKRILSPSFHGDYFVPPLGFLPAANPQNACAQSVSYFCLVQNSVDAFFCDVQAAFGAFHRIGKQPAHLGLLNLRFRRPLGGRDGVENPTFGHTACVGYKHPT